VGAGAAGQEPLQRALELAYRLLAHRDPTTAAVRRRLEAKDLSHVAGEAVAELERLGYLDDVRFARRFAEDRRRLDGWGAERIERRLRELGIDDGLVAGVLVDHGPEREVAAAVGLLRRRFPEPLGDDRERRRALGLLLRRGYELELAHDAIRAHQRAA
jgi:regulatory protein